MNRWQISGRLGQDSVNRMTGTGKELTEFSLAVREGTKENPTTTWIRCTVWGGMALAKGQEVFIDGKYQMQEYTAKDGTKKQSVSCVANSWNVWVREGQGHVASTADADFIPEYD